MKEQADGPAVCPLQIVKDQQQGTPVCHSTQDIFILLKQIDLRQFRASGREIACVRPTPRVGPTSRGTPRGGSGRVATETTPAQSGRPALFHLLRWRGLSRQSPSANAVSALAPRRRPVGGCPRHRKAYVIWPQMANRDRQRQREHCSGHRWLSAQGGETPNTWRIQLLGPISRSPHCHK